MSEDEKEERTAPVDDGRAARERAGGDELLEDPEAYEALDEAMGEGSDALGAASLGGPSV